MQCRPTCRIVCPAGVDVSIARPIVTHVTQRPRLGSQHRGSSTDRKLGCSDFREEVSVADSLSRVVWPDLMATRGEVMGRFDRGQRVLVPCEIQPGPFPAEWLVTVSSDRGKVSGFVKASFLVNESGLPPPAPGSAYLMGIVEAATNDQVTVRLPGSFFTTASGVTSVSSSWARQHLHNPQELSR